MSDSVDESGTVSGDEFGAAAASLSEIGAHATPVTAAVAPDGNVLARSAAATDVQSPSQPQSGSTSSVVVTTTPYPLVAIILAAFLAGVVVSIVAKWFIDKRDQMKRSEQLIRPLLVPHNG